MLRYTLKTVFILQVVFVSYNSLNIVEAVSDYLNGYIDEHQFGIVVEINVYIKYLIYIVTLLTLKWLFNKRFSFFDANKLIYFFVSILIIDLLINVVVVSKALTYYYELSTIIGAITFLIYGTMVLVKCKSDLYRTKILYSCSIIVFSVFTFLIVLIGEPKNFVSYFIYFIWMLANDAFIIFQLLLLYRASRDINIDYLASTSHVFDLKNTPLAQDIQKKHPRS